MRRVAASLALVLCLLGCETVPASVLTGSSEMCYAGPGPVVEGPLLLDPEFGTAIYVERSEARYPYHMPRVGSTVPVMWPTGYTARRNWFELEVLNEAGEVVAATGRRYALEPPVPLGDTNPAYQDGGPWPACGVFPTTPHITLPRDPASGIGSDRRGPGTVRIPSRGLAAPARSRA